VNPTGVRSRRRQEMTARIIDAAGLLLQQTGSASLRAVANEVGVTTPALYRYVSGPEGLLAMVAASADQALSQQIRMRLERVDSTDRVEALVVSATEVWQWASRHPDQFRLVADAVSRSRPVQALAPISATAAIFDEIVRRSGPRPPLADQPLVAAQMSAQLWFSLLAAASPRSYEGRDRISRSPVRRPPCHHLDGPEALGRLARIIPDLLDALRPSPEVVWNDGPRHLGYPAPSATPNGAAKDRPDRTSCRPNQVRRIGARSARPTRAHHHPGHRHRTPTRRIRPSAHHRHR
jgi:AcrR family transcriptional regulator